MGAATAISKIITLIKLRNEPGGSSASRWPRTPRNIDNPSIILVGILSTHQLRDTPEGLPTSQALSCRALPSSLTVTEEAAGAESSVCKPGMVMFTGLAQSHPRPCIPVPVCAASLAGCVPAIRDPRSLWKLMYRLVQLSLQHNFSQQSVMAVTWEGALLYAC